MKQLSAYPWLVLYFFSLLGCSKSGQIEEKPSIVLLRETKDESRNTLTFGLRGSSLGTIRWECSPANGTAINSLGNTAIVTFGSKGSYVVKAYDGSMRLEARVAVDTSHYAACDECPQIYNEKVPFLDDGILVTPSLIDISQYGGVVPGSGIALRLNFLTNSIYHDLATLHYTIGPGENGILTVDFSAVQIYNYGAGARVPSQARDQSPPLRIPDGISKFQIKIMGKLYTGVINNLDDKMLITWPYSSGVTFTKLELLK
jgi:hypothetical protein